MNSALIQQQLNIVLSLSHTFHSPKLVILTHYYLPTLQNNTQITHALGSEVPYHQGTVLLPHGDQTLALTLRGGSGGREGAQHGTAGMHPQATDGALVVGRRSAVERVSEKKKKEIRNCFNVCWNRTRRCWRD